MHQQARQGPPGGHFSFGGRAGGVFPSSALHGLVLAPYAAASAGGRSAVCGASTASITLRLLALSWSVRQPAPFGEDCRSFWAGKEGFECDRLGLFLPRLVRTMPVSR
jgi:hypothetical protein